jgi:hypothetical protein
MFAAKKEHSQALPVTQTGKNPAGDGTPVGSFDEEQPKTFTTDFNWPVAIFSRKKEQSKF